MEYVDLIIKNGNVYNTFLQQFENKDIAILNGKFYYISNNMTEIKANSVIDYKGKYIIPGFIDIHMHIESSMTVPSQFSKMVLPYGVTTVVADPHEIANVLGIDGINYFLSSDTTLDIFYGIPSSVPSTNSYLETTGGKILEEDVLELLKNPKIICLGEVMNFKELISKDDTLIKNIIKICKENKSYLPIEGHCPKISGLDLSKFIYAGVDSDHTQQTAESIYEKITNGMFLEIQRKSINKDTIKTLVENNFYEYFAFVTDDVMVDQLKEGHLNKIVKMAVDLGMPINKAIYCATYTPARRMNLTDRGCISVGKIADFIVLDNIENLKIKDVYKNGNLYLGEDSKKENFPQYFYNTVKCDKAVLEDFELKTNKKDSVLCNVIQINKDSTFTKKITKKLPVVNGKINWEDSGLSLLVVYERYNKTGNKAYALVEGAINKKGAIATTLAHDHHNLMVIGISKKDMLIAQNSIVDMQGGYVVCEDEQIKAKAILNVGGIVNDGDINELAKDIKNVRKAMKNLGYEHINEIMSFSTLSLPVSPEIKITDKGMLYTKTQKFINIEGE
ncbi:adenine deaminase C-terminal domain-containing protein [uncultured Tyzzerella sp.]|uniref:adenine deaminase C-terminal domain-containing protein n=1 Tax=uncultured Tyzzerella sp. TaxID=2321398 RepID=UPI002943F8C5|nr:adenine deaminase C-terminal domain-containing protein [uncultured Tyzzerella sp.]